MDAKSLLGVASMAAGVVIGALVAFMPFHAGSVWAGEANCHALPVAVVSLDSKSLTDEQQQVVAICESGAWSRTVVAGTIALAGGLGGMAILIYRRQTTTPVRPTAAPVPVLPPPNWYPDPSSAGVGQRYWDGERWTEQVRS